MPTTINFDAAYTVEGYRGIAWRLKGYAKEWTEPDWEFIGGSDDDREDESNYVLNEPEEIEDRTKVEAIMVGDDRVFVFDVDDLTELDEDEYCPGCGQIGCGAYH